MSQCNHRTTFLKPWVGKNYYQLSRNCVFVFRRGRLVRRWEEKEDKILLFYNVHSHLIA
jgi:hypothetical protein